MKLIVFVRMMKIFIDRDDQMTNFEIRHLRMVAAIAASGSVTRAASEVHLTQSAVSHQLRDIEDRLGTPLFLRVGKRMVPTAAGRRVLATAQRVLDELAAAEDDVRRLGANKSGVLRVCAQCNTGYHWLPPLIEVFRVKHPQVDVAIAVECTMRPVEALLDGRLDLAIVTQAIRNQHLRIRPLFDDEHAAIVAPDHPFASRTFVRPEDFARGASAAVYRHGRRQLHGPADPSPGGRRAPADVVRDADGSDPGDGQGRAWASA